MAVMICRSGYHETACRFESACSAFRVSTLSGFNERFPRGEVWADRGASRHFWSGRGANKSPIDEFSPTIAFDPPFDGKHSVGARFRQAAFRNPNEGCAWPTGRDFPHSAMINGSRVTTNRSEATRNRKLLVRNALKSRNGAKIEPNSRSRELLQGCRICLRLIPKCFKGGTNAKPHAICDRKGRPLNLFATAGRDGDRIGARALRSSLPSVE